MGGTGVTGGLGQQMGGAQVMGSLGSQNLYTSGNSGAQHGQAGRCGRGGMIIGNIGMVSILCI